MENVLDIPLRLLFIKLAVACDDDENNDDVAVDDVVDDIVVVIIVVIGLLTMGCVYGIAYDCVVNDVEYDVEYDGVNDMLSVNNDDSTICGCFCNKLSVYEISLLTDFIVVAIDVVGVIAPK